MDELIFRQATIEDAYFVATVMEAKMVMEDGRLFIFGEDYLRMSIL